ncbi:zeta toxin family protein [Streptomyces sp. NPDC048636]|uniref:zeta toxin family protein n=1 Tax=Streptomyces sp. NPDC048636 TaxID=3155762 RepID=UPI003424BC88
MFRTRRSCPQPRTARCARTSPVTVFIAGTPGSGKTALADLVHAVLDRRGGAARIGRDLYKARAIVPGARRSLGPAA